MHVAFASGTRVWGGSEELWAASAASLARSGHRVTVFKSRVDPDEPAIRVLRTLGVPISDLARFPLIPRPVFGGLALLSRPAAYAHEVARLRLGLIGSRPDLVVISQGTNYDGILLAEVCRRLGLRYVLLSQKASDLYWPPDNRSSLMRRVYRGALECHFVAEHNRRLTEEQLGFALPNAVVVRNPYLVPWERRNDWPDGGGILRLACIGRLYPMEKGQDLLLRVLARDRWRGRLLQVTFFGSGRQENALPRMAAHLGLESVTFAGFTRDVPSIWSAHHGLVAPSRGEGLPLVLVEAMLSGRVPIVTDAGGNREVLEDGVTGFIAPAPSEDALDDAMERAWMRRDEWRGIGARAAEAIRELVPADPGRVYADMLVSLATRR